VPGGVRAAHVTVTATGLASPDLMSNPSGGRGRHGRLPATHEAQLTALELAALPVAREAPVGDRIASGR
jgi:hypothetical protein